MAFKMKGFPLIKGTSPAKKYVSDAQRKAVHASKAEKSAAKFNEGLRKASAEGKLDDNPKFKAAVDKSPINLKEGKKPTKRYVSKKTSKEYGSSGGYTKTEFGKGGRKGDKVHKATTLEKREATPKSYRGKGESDKPSYYQTKTKVKTTGKKKGEKTESFKEISEKKYRRKLARKTKRSIKRGDDVETSAMKLSEKDKKKAMDNAMPEAKVRSRTYQDLKADKKAMKESKERLKAAKQRAATGGDPEKEAYNKAKARERKIQSQLDVSPLKVKKGDPASVTNRLNEGDKKGASLERRRGKAASKGKTGKAKRLARKLKEHDSKDNRGKQKARTTEVKQGGRIQF